MHPNNLFLKSIPLCVMLIILITTIAADLFLIKNAFLLASKIPLAFLAFLYFKKINGAGDSS